MHEPFETFGGGAGTTAIGLLLRDWRERRRYSQMALALEADVSARHLSFLETGRSKPSREMLLRLAASLEVPHRDRNAMLIAAGFAPAFDERPLGDGRLEQVRHAMHLMLAGFSPCPALAVDRHWTLVAANDAVGWLLEGIAPELTRAPVNVLRVSLQPGGLASRIVNLGEWRAHLLARLRREMELTADAALVALYEELRAYPAPPTRTEPSADGALPVAMPLRLRTAHGVLSFLSTTTVFGTAVDITVSELVIESFFPADARTAAVLNARKTADARNPIDTR